VDKDGKIYVAGSSVGLNSDYDYFVVKYDSSGTKDWVVRYDSLNVNDYLEDLAIDTSGNIYVTGYSAFTCKY